MKIKKPNIHIFVEHKKYYLYDVNINAVVTIPYELYEFFSLWGKEDEKEITADIEEDISFLMEQGFLTEKKKISSIKHYETDTLKDLYMYNMGNVILQVTQNCNLRCEYCVYSGSYINRVHTNKRMSFETAVKTIDFLAAHSLNCNEVSIGFYGGEPLLEIELIKKAVSYAKEVFGEKKVNFNMTTNATLLNMDIADFLVQNDFNITISLDGPRNIHNKNRIFANSNKGTFDLIMENIALIREKYPFFDKKISFNAVIDLKQNVSCTNEFFLNYDTVKGLNVNGTFINPVNRKEILDFDPELNAISNYEVFKVFLYAFIIDFRMTVLVLLFIPIKCVVMKYFAKKQKQIMDEFIKRNQEYAKWFGDTVGGVREVKLFNILDKKHEEFVLNQNNIIEKQKQMNMLGQWNTIIDSIMVQFLSTLLYILGANLVFDMKLSVGSVFAFITYSAYVTGPISAILNIGYLLSGIIPSTKRYYAFMELEEETDNGKKTDLCPNDLRLQKVSFAYERDKCILKNIDILFAKSSKTAIIGRNGSGKTTIINLLTRMYEPTSGEILLGAENISELPLPEYRNMVSVVSQQIYLFNDTIRNNICLYKQIDDTVIEAACKDSGLEDFIKEVSLDHVVGQNGAMLSGGQKQKIALARALVHDKPIIIFDEATSNTDAYSEQQINGLLDTRLKDKTVIVITHKKEILSKVDQIVVLKEGVVADLGRYDDLIGKSDELNVMLEKAE